MWFLIDICRLCLSGKGDLHNIHKNKITDKILACIGDLKFEENIPAYVCSKCLNQLETFLQFKNLCQKSSVAVNDYINKLPRVPQLVNKKLQVNLSNDSAIITKSLRNVKRLTNNTLSSFPKLVASTIPYKIKNTIKGTNGKPLLSFEASEFEKFYFKNIKRVLNGENSMSVPKCSIEILHEDVKIHKKHKVVLKNSNNVINTKGNNHSLSHEFDDESKLNHLQTRHRRSNKFNRILYRHFHANGSKRYSANHSQSSDNSPSCSKASCSPTCGSEQVQKRKGKLKKSKAISENPDVINAIPKNNSILLESFDEFEELCNNFCASLDAKPHELNKNKILLKNIKTRSNKHLESPVDSHRFEHFYKANYNQLMDENSDLKVCINALAKLPDSDVKTFASNSILTNKNDDTNKNKGRSVDRVHRNVGSPDNNKPSTSFKRKRYLNKSNKKCEMKTRSTSRRRL